MPGQGAGRARPTLNPRRGAQLARPTTLVVPLAMVTAPAAWASASDA